MNFLAHLALCEDHPQARLGSLLPDLCRPQRWDHWPRVTVRAIEQHRLIDRLTDVHASHAALREHLRAVVGRWNGVVADVLLDHVLAVQWSQRHGQPWQDFRDAVYRDLGTQGDITPPEVSVILRRMIEGDWLTAYGSIEGMRHVLTMMSARYQRRFAREVSLSHAADWLAANDAVMRACFEPLWQDLCEQAGPQRVCEARGGRGLSDSACQALEAGGAGERAEAGGAGEFGEAVRCLRPRATVEGA